MAARGSRPPVSVERLDLTAQGQVRYAMKLFAHRPQDLADAHSALDAAGDNLDLPLLRRLERFGQETARALDAALRAR